MAGEIPTNNDLDDLFHDEYGVDQEAGKKQAIANGAVLDNPDDPVYDDGTTMY